MTLELGTRTRITRNTRVLYLILVLEILENTRVSYSKLGLEIEFQSCFKTKKAFLSKKYPNINSEPVETETDLSQASSEEDSLNGLFEDDTYNDPATIGNEIESVRLDTEKIEFLKIIDSHNFFTDDTSKFWFDNSKKLKFLNELALVLWNIPSSSAYIERFYSIVEMSVKPELVT